MARFTEANLAIASEIITRYPLPKSAIGPLCHLAQEQDGYLTEQAMAQIVGQLGSGSTDYGQALLDLNEHHPEVIDRRTTVLILGDARSNRTDPRLDLFRGLVARAKRVVCLCPEVPGRWGTGDSCMLQYQPHCSHVAHCASLSDLEREIDDMLLAYD